MSGSSELKFLERTEMNSNTLGKIEELVKETNLSKEELMNIFMTENDRVDLSRMDKKDRMRLKQK